MSGRWRIMLIVSLAINIFLIGGIAGGVWRWRHNAGLGLSQGWRARVIDALPDADAERFRTTMRDTVSAARPLVRAGRDGRERAAEAFVATNYDAAAVGRALADARAADVVLRGRVEDALVRFGATLPQPQRQTLAKALRRGPLRQPARQVLKPQE